METKTKFLMCVQGVTDPNHFVCSGAGYEKIPGNYKRVRVNGDATHLLTIEKDKQFVVQAWANNNKTFVCRPDNSDRLNCDIK